MGFPTLDNIAIECLLTALEAIDIASQRVDDPDAQEVLGHAAMALATLLDVAGQA